MLVKELCVLKMKFLCIWGKLFVVRRAVLGVRGIWFFFKIEVVGVSWWVESRSAEVL